MSYRMLLLPPLSRRLRILYVQYELSRDAKVSDDQLTMGFPLPYANKSKKLNFVIIPIGKMYKVSQFHYNFSIHKLFHTCNITWQFKRYDHLKSYRASRTILAVIDCRSWKFCPSTQLFYQTVWPAWLYRGKFGGYIKVQHICSNLIIVIYLHNILVIAKEVKKGRIRVLLLLV